MRTQIKRTRLTLLLLGLGVATTMGCARRSSNVVIAQPVGPAPSEQGAIGSRGWLVVVTESAVHPDPAEAFQQHGSGRLGYTILGATGAVVQRIDSGENAPIPITLEPGLYRVKADSLSGATVEATVRIESSRTTELYLDGSRTLSRNAPNDGAVLGPDGSFVGWRAATL